MKIHYITMVLFPELKKKYSLFSLRELIDFRTTYL